MIEDNWLSRFSRLCREGGPSPSRIILLSLGMDGFLQIRDLGLQRKREPREERSGRAWKLRSSRDLNQTPGQPRAKPSAGPRRRRKSRRAGAYRVLELDAALDDLAAAPGHDGDIHAPSGVPPLVASGSSKARRALLEPVVEVETKKAGWGRRGPEWLVGSEWIRLGENGREGEARSRLW